MALHAEMLTRIALPLEVSADELLGLVKFEFWVSYEGCLRKRKEEIGKYFVNFDSSDSVEGLNNKIKVLKRRRFGLGSPLFKRLKPDLRGYDLYGFFTKHNMECRLREFI